MREAAVDPAVKGEEEEPAGGLKQQRKARPSASAMPGDKQGPGLETTDFSSCQDGGQGPSTGATPALLGTKKDYALLACGLWGPPHTSPAPHLRPIRGKGTLAVVALGPAGHEQRSATGAWGPHLACRCAVRPA